MDFGHVRARGRSATRKAWITNPLRSMLWRLILPYFQGFSDEIQRQRQSELISLQEKITHELTSLQEKITSHLAGTRKDAMAMAHRLAGLEEEGSLAEQVRTTIIERLTSAAAEAHEAATYVRALHADVRSSAQTLGERLTSAAAEAHQAATYVSSLHAEVKSSVQTLNDRIDFLTRATPMRVGDRVSVGQDDLVLVTTASSQHFLVRQHDLIGRLITDGREWEPHVRAAIERAARADAVAVDAGAYVGLHTVTMSRWFHTVHAFEPQRGIYQVLCGNLVLNGCSNVIAHNAALYDRSSSMRLAPQEKQEVPVPLLNGQPDYSRITNAAALAFEIVEAGSGEVLAIKLDDLVLEDVALMKVDTQGADLQVLRGAEQTIRRCRPLVLFEWERDLSAQHGTKLEDYFAFFACIDYDIEVLQETSPGRQTDYLASPR